jgi:hypothetical protein
MIQLAQGEAIALREGGAREQYCEPEQRDRFHFCASRAIQPAATGTSLCTRPGTLRHRTATDTIVLSL